MSRKCCLLVLAAGLSLSGGGGCGDEAGVEAGSSAAQSSVASSVPSAASSATSSAVPPGSAVPGPSETAASHAAAPELEPDASALPELEGVAATLEEQRSAMVKRMRALEAADEARADELLAFLQKSKRMGQGNPALRQHPMTRTECVARRKAAGVRDEKKLVCGAAFMAPVYDPRAEKEEDARVCIDRYEFPGIPCEYPMTWASTSEAQQICKIMGKRLCDAHEWEGACAGELLAAKEEYAFGRPHRAMQGLHNLGRQVRWAYGFKKDHKKCATGSAKSKTCTSSGWKHCGSNTFPAGAFPECKSPFGVYDLHGNVAEHMALPMRAEELGSRGGFGAPEMKGSWFIFGQVEAHTDDCRWRAPDWHANEGKHHFNYHLGFRCCKDVGTALAKGSPDALVSPEKSPVSPERGDKTSKGAPLR